MRLLVVTQAVDSNDPVLGFFVRWIEEFAKHVEHIEVICLREGKHALPQNVRVHSLGKERGRPLFGSLTYAWRFLSLAWRLRRDYDTVFVHMNQEYILLSGWLWKFLGKPIYFWRNHYAGSWLTDAAASFCEKVFCTSKHSYTAKYKKIVLMPVGVDTERFKPDPSVERRPHSILFLARMAPSKRPDILLDALAVLAREGVEFTADFVGSPLPKDEAYYEALKERARSLGSRVAFLPAVPNAETPRLYQSHQVFVNCSPSGMLDKTLFEAAACGAIVLSSSQDFAELVGVEGHFRTVQELAEKLADALPQTVGESPSFVAAHGLSALGEKIAAVLYSAHP